MDVKLKGGNNYVEKNCGFFFFQNLSWHWAPKEVERRSNGSNDSAKKKKKSLSMCQTYQNRGEIILSTEVNI